MNHHTPEQPHQATKAKTMPQQAHHNSGSPVGNAHAGSNRQQQTNIGVSYGTNSGNTLNSNRSPTNQITMGGVGPHSNTKKSTSPKYNTSFLDREERELINMANNLSKEEIWEKLEQKRFNQLKQAAVNLQSDLLLQSHRCPKCTLLPPCKHYQTQEQILQELPSLIQQPQFKQNLSPRKREIIQRTLRDTQKIMINNSNYASKNMLSEEQFALQGQNDQRQEINSLNKLDNDGVNEQQQINAFEGVSQMISPQSNYNQPSSLSKNSYLGNRVNRNSMMNNTMGPVGGPMGFRGLVDQPNQNSNMNLMNIPSKLSHYGANVMLSNSQMNQTSRRHFLRKGKGNGGSPVPEAATKILNESRISGNADDGNLTKGAALIARNRDMTTVRIRTKNNQYVYGEASFTNPLNTTKNETVRNHSYFQDNGFAQQNLQERERVQAMIAKYREEKIQKQIEKIEQEKLKIELEKQQQREDEIRRKKYNEQLKQKIQQYHEVRMQEHQQKSNFDKELIERQRQKERQRKQYYDQQKKYIDDYREQKKRTDELLLIPTQAQQQRHLYYQQFPSPQRHQGGGIYHSAQPSIMLNQQNVKSGQGLIQPNQNHISNRQKYNEGDFNQDDEYQDDNRGQSNQNNDQDDVYEPYYDEDDANGMLSDVVTPNNDKLAQQPISNQSATEKQQTIKSQKNDNALNKQTFQIEADDEDDGQLDMMRGQQNFNNSSRQIPQENLDSNYLIERK